MLVGWCALSSVGLADLDPDPDTYPDTDHFSLQRTVGWLVCRFISWAYLYPYMDKDKYKRNVGWMVCLIISRAGRS